MTRLVHLESSCHLGPSGDMPRIVSLAVPQLIHSLLAQIKVGLVVIQAVVEHLLLLLASVFLGDVSRVCCLFHLAFIPLRILLHIIWLYLVVSVAHSRTSVAPSGARGRHRTLDVVVKVTAQRGQACVLQSLLRWSHQEGLLVYFGWGCGTPAVSLGLLN